MSDSPRKINTERVAADIEMLKTYTDDESLAPFMAALETLRDNPEQETLGRLAEEFNKLGIQQGTILSYAQYVIVLLSEHPDVHSMEDTPDFDEE